MDVATETELEKVVAAIKAGIVKQFDTYGNRIASPQQVTFNYIQER